MKKTKPVLRIVTAPGTWHCKCGREIRAGEKCGKAGKLVICMKCLEKEARNAINQVQQS